MSTFQRNAIISGYINSYCLICESFFDTEDQTFSHIKSEEHDTRKLLYPYLEKYGNNGIRKVKAGYFCEHCSLLMATAVKVNLHIAEKLHYYNKGNSLLKQSGSVLTAFDDVLISEDAWHSFAEDACALCDAEFDDGKEHKMERSHVVKLLQNKVQFGEDNNIYRKVDKNNFQCLTCNTVSTQNTIDEHFNADEHKQKYIQCQEEKKKYDLANPIEMKVKTVTKTEPEKKTAVGTSNVVINNVETVAGKDVTNTEKTGNIQETEATTTPGIKPKKVDETVKIKKEESNDPAIFATDNNLTYSPRITNAFCKTCNKKIPSTLFSMKEHIKGRDHIKKLAKAASKPTPRKINIRKQPMEFFVESIYTFNNTLDNDTVINESICVPAKSCHLLTTIQCNFAEFKCQLCLENLSEDDLEDHCRTMKHEKAMRQTKIVLDLKNELIREVHPDNFHCGYCNLMIPCWPAVKEHLKSFQHKSSTANCSRRLQIHMPAIKAQENADKAKAAFLEFVNHMRM